MNSQISTTLARYKLHATFDGDSVEHTTHTSDLRSRQRRVHVKTRWTREKELGSGAFGVVWSEMEETTKELRAVKIIPKRMLNVREVEALAELQDHPDLFVLFLGWFEDRDSIYLAMEYIGHGDLGKFIKEHPIQAKGAAAVIASQILEGLVVLHDRGICHRDMKPQNILIASITPIWIKISDFGISKRTTGTMLRTSCGTTCYKAPEQQGLLPRHMRSGNQYSNAVDLWALGVVIHEVLTSEIPFLDTYLDSDLDTDFASCMLNPVPQLDGDMLHNYCTGSDPFPVESLRKSGVSDEGVDFVKGLMAPNPADRMTAKNALSCLPSIQDFCKATSGVVESINPPMVASLSLIGPALLIRQLLGLHNPPLPDQINRFAPEDQALLNQLLILVEEERVSGASNTISAGITKYVDFLVKYIKQRPLRRSWKFDRVRLDIPAWPSYAHAINMILGSEADAEQKAPGKDCRIASKLAKMFDRQGMYDEERQCLEWVLVHREKALGKDSPQTLSTVHEMAMSFHKVAWWDKALEWYERALAGRERVLGSDDPGTLDSVGGMAKVFKMQGMYIEALDLFGRALAWKRRTLGDDHPRTLYCVMEMANVYHKQGMYNKALNLYDQALTGQKKALGKEHPDTRKTRTARTELINETKRLNDLARKEVESENQIGASMQARFENIVGDKNRTPTGSSGRDMGYCARRGVGPGIPEN